MKESNIAKYSLRQGRSKKVCSYKSARVLVCSLFMLVFLVERTVLPANGQDADSRILHIQTNMNDALVYVDSTMLGRAAAEYFSISKNATLLELIPSNSDAWSIKPLVSKLGSHRGDTIALVLNFKHHYYLNSVPFDAEVFHEEDNDAEFIGLTPLLFESNGPLTGELVFVKEGYEKERITAGQGIWNNHKVFLELPASLTEPDLEYSARDQGRQITWLDYTLAGATLVSGLMAIRYKMEADDRYAKYAENGDPLLRPPVRRMDTYAGIALGTMQVGLGVLAIRLVINKK